ncbi:hypothetical protein [Microseira wollei]|uniref:Uncharacterized protein n=1 Tax=Microseira wollei NIES-4236 TaxID=2530354 RepID=A0AAV3XHF8_9CYAN|nr:hypothetical protein [Microseira wollei]GET42038.1 hypothetical protein MiSe_68520 [Microseira wollei NIES-4236]
MPAAREGIALLSNSKVRAIAMATGLTQHLLIVGATTGGLLLGNTIRTDANTKVSLKNR